MKRRFVALIGLALLSVTTLATAGPPQGLVEDSKEVKFVSTDLETLAGIAKLYARIESAAKRVCHEPAMGEWGRYPAYRQCVKVAIDDAVEQLQSPALTALYHKRAQRRVD